MATSPRRSPSKRPWARGFAADAATERALRAGLAGRDARIQRGRLAAAVRTLAAEPPAKLVFVDLDGAAEPGEAARQLTGVCAFDTALVALGSTDTAQFGRTLMQCGIADYLVKPVTAAAVREAAAAVADDAPEHLYAGKVIAFAGSPGSGTSTLVAAVARGIAADGRTASVVDLDPVSGRLPPLLGAEPVGGLPALLGTPAAAAAAIAEGEGEGDAELEIDPDRIGGLTTPAAPGISLVAHPPAAGLEKPRTAPVLAALFKYLANRTHVVLATGMPDPETQLAVMRQADGRVLVYEPTLPSISTAVRLLARLGADSPALLVQCSTRMRRYTLSPAHIRYALADRRPGAVIPFERALHAGATGGAAGRPGRAYRKAMQRAVALVGSDRGE